MKVVIKIYESSPCIAKIFNINDKKAYLDDFGEIKRQNLDRYQCNLSGFAAKMPSNKILNKYKITVDEYAEIVEYLNTVFDYGVCYMCM